MKINENMKASDPCKIQVIDIGPDSHVGHLLIIRVPKQKQFGIYQYFQQAHNSIFSPRIFHGITQKHGLSNYTSVVVRALPWLF
jgi:hypothetical protein